jgi:hypothetical protein
MRVSVEANDMNYSLTCGKRSRRLFVLVPAALAISLMLGLENVRADERPLVLEDNLNVLNASAPDENYRFVGSNAPGQLFVPREPVTLKFEFAKVNDSGTVRDFRIELQEITTRNPDARTRGGFTDTSGYAPMIGLEGQPTRVPITVQFSGEARTEFEVQNFPLPEKFGTYAMILIRGDKRHFLGTVARVPQPRADGTIENVPLFGEGALIDHEGNRAAQYARMGVRGWRSELSWNEREDGSVDWAKFDKLFAAAKQAGCQIMITLGGHPEWTRPFHVPTPAANWTPETNGYGGTGDWLCRPELYARYGKWIETFVRRYWEGGKGALWGLENYNEPWEGGGISGWASDSPHYRELQKLIATSAKKVDPRVRILAASSIMNTEDKFYSDGTNEFDAYLDIFTDHYVPPVGCYGPMVAKAHGKGSMETETWFVNSEYSLAQGAVQFLASGQARIAPWHPRVLFDTLPGSQDRYLIPAPVSVATAAFNNMVTGKPLEKMLFTEHLPLAFQFGKDDDRAGLVIVFGRLIPIGADNYRVLLWPQINGTPGGTLKIDNSDGLLEFYDLAGNPVHRGKKTVEIPMSFLPTYIKSTQGPAAVAQRLKEAKIEGKRFLEIIPLDFNTLPNAPGAALRVELRNRLNREVTGQLQVSAPTGLKLKDQGPQQLTLQPGEKKLVQLPIEQAELSAANTYPCRFNFSSPDGDAEYSEELNAAVAPRGTKTVDGNLDDWSAVPGVKVIATEQKVNLSEQLRRPWLEVQQGNPQATFGELKMAWDDNFLYIGARVNDPTPEPGAFRFSERDENSYFHSAASDTVSPYKEFIEEFRRKTGDPKRSFAEVPYVYRRSPELGIPFRRDRLQFGFDLTPDSHGLQQVVKVPDTFHAMPDTDYEYSLYWVDDNKNGSAELWRYSAPGIPRIHDWPRQTRGKPTTGPVREAKVAVRRDGNVYLYEAAIPRTEFANLTLQPGTDFGFTFALGNSKGANAYYGTAKAVTKNNSLTLHPYWENSPDASTRWTLID